MSRGIEYSEQDEYTGKLVVETFYRVAGKSGTTAADITKFLRDKFGKVWRMNILARKVEKTLRRGAALGFLRKRGLRYVAVYPKANGGDAPRKRGRPPVLKRRACEPLAHRLHSRGNRHNRHSAYPNRNHFRRK